VENLFSMVWVLSSAARSPFPSIVVFELCLALADTSVYQLAVHQFNSVLYNILMDPQVPDPERAVNIEQGLVIEPRVEGQQPKDNHWISILAMANFYTFFSRSSCLPLLPEPTVKNMLANYQSQPTSSPPLCNSRPDCNWKVFANPEWGISLSYPTTWSEFTTSGGEYFLNRIR